MIKMYIVVCGEYKGHYPIYAVDGHETVYDTEKIPNLSVLNHFHVEFDENMNISTIRNSDLFTIFNHSRVTLYTEEEAKKMIKEISECNFLNKNDKKNPQMIEINIDPCIIY